MPYVTFVGKLTILNSLTVIISNSKSAKSTKSKVFSLLARSEIDKEYRFKPIEDQRKLKKNTRENKWSKTSFQLDTILYRLVCLVNRMCSDEMDVGLVGNVDDLTQEEFEKKFKGLWEEYATEIASMCANRSERVEKLKAKRRKKQGRYNRSLV